MNLRRLGERGFIREVARRFGVLAPAPPKGPGDDAAVVASAGAGRLVVTTDCLVEDVHFRRGESPFLLGRKALAVNLSDIAAMGGRPIAFLLTLGLPPGLSPGTLERLLQGLLSRAREDRVALVGGDTSSSPGGLIVSITLIGRVARRSVLTRSGARPGDGIYVSGPLGSSAAGRRLLEAGWRPRLDPRGRRITAPRPPARGRPRPEGWSARAVEALRRHLDPEPRLAVGRRLLEKRIASAAIDLSDGLSIDLRRLAEASGVGARLCEPALPIGDPARHLAAMLGTTPLELALDGGEDYELLFTAPPARERLVHDLDVFWIGEIVPSSRGLTLADAGGRERTLRSGGYEHFASAARRRSPHGRGSRAPGRTPFPPAPGQR